MNNYQLSRRDLTSNQVKDIVEGRAQIPPEYPLGTPEYISFQLARQNYLLDVRNKYLRFIKWVVAGAAVVTIVGLSYLNYTLDKVGKKIEQNTVNIVKLEQSLDKVGKKIEQTTIKLEQSVNELHTSLASTEDSLASLEKTFNDSMIYLNKSLDEMKKMNEELKNARKDLRDTQADLESVVEHNSIK